MREKNHSDCKNSEWLESLEDPVRKKLPDNGLPDLDAVLKLFPRPVGQPAFDEELIKGNIARLKTFPAVNTGHELLDLSVKTGLAMIDATFQGNHPKYGVKEYAENRHDGFPPTVISAVDALSAWGMEQRAKEIFTYYLDVFVKDNGSIDYWGPSLSEYGQLLNLANMVDKRIGAEGWLSSCFKPLNRMSEYLLGLIGVAENEDVQLVKGVPEADEYSIVRKFFHNNVWVARGLSAWGELCRRRGLKSKTPAKLILAKSKILAGNTITAIEKTWRNSRVEWWLPPQVEPLAPDEVPGNKITETRFASYTNYRYWPELLSSGILPRRLAGRVVEARLISGGQFCGMTRFADWLDDWTLYDYLHGLWMLGRKKDFLFSLYGHVAYHQAEGHLTAYEQVTFPPGKEKAAYCLPCQLTAARAVRLFVKPEIADF